jgi:hypothetical protein
MVYVYSDLEFGMEKKKKQVQIGTKEKRRGEEGGEKIMKKTKWIELTCVPTGNVCLVISVTGTVKRK